MSERREETGMSDLQYEDRLRAVVADLEHIKRLGVGEEAAAEIGAVIERFRLTIES